jgi:hypothetical protein
LNGSTGRCKGRVRVGADWHGIIGFRISRRGAARFAARHGGFYTRNPFGRGYIIVEPAGKEVPA